MQKQNTTDRKVDCADCGNRCFGPTFNFGRVQCGNCFFTQCKEEQRGKFPFNGQTVAEARAQQQ